MEKKQIKILGANLKTLTDYLTANLSFEYQNHSQDMSLLVTEEFYFRNNSTQLNMVAAKATDEAVLLDIIAGGGGTGWFNISWGSEGDYVYYVEEALRKYCEAEGFSLEVIAAEV